MSSSSSVIVRTFEPADQAACREIFELVHKSYGHPDAFVTLTLRTDMANIEQFYLNEPNGHFWVAVSADDGRVLGHVALLPLKRADPLFYQQVSEDRRDEIGELRRMAIDPSVQRRGVGKRLVANLIDFARTKGYKQIHLTTARNMDKAVAFYDQLGFRRGQIDRYTFTDLDFQSETSLEAVLKNMPPPISFERQSDMPDEDQQRIDRPPTDTAYLYVQHYSLDLN